MKRKLPLARWLAPVFALTAAASCVSTPTDNTARRAQQPQDDPPKQPATKALSSTEMPGLPMVESFVPASPASYVAKVKDLLVGQPPSDEEVRAVTLDPTALRGLIDRWMATPEYRAKMMVFFRNAFQQGQIGNADLIDQLPNMIRANGTVTTKLVRGLQESFARTVLALIDEGKPFNDVITTRRFMLNPPLMSLLAYIDSVSANDKNQRSDRLLKANPKFQVTLHNTGPVIPLNETLDPQSPNYMHWNNPIPIPGNAPLPCLAEPRVYKANTQVLFDFLMGYLDGIGLCQPAYAGAAQFTDADFDSWRMVTIRAPQMGEEPTSFFDLPSLRKADVMIGTIPRIGFFSTVAFFANWPTNTSNLGRVTINQTLIVALGASFDDSNDINPIMETALDKEHAAPGSACYACHKTLDPMRQYFRQAYSLYYHEQTDPIQTALPGVFAFGGETSAGEGIMDMATKLAAHPNFAGAWAQKVCFWANSAACSVDDPEFQRVTDNFKKSGFNWATLLRDMLSSPLTTGAQDTKTFADRGVVVNVARRDSLCTALSTRLGIPDVCGLNGGNGIGKAKALSTAVPSDGYNRGSVAPLLSNDPSLFLRAGTENLCRSMADAIIDAGSPPRYSSRQPDSAIAEFVHNVMALPQMDPRAVSVQQILTDHYTSTLRAGLKPVDALKSTFVLACESPTSIARGL